MAVSTGLVPVPDPTVLTTAQLILAIENVKELLICQIKTGDELCDGKIQHNYLMDEKRHRETREWLEAIKAHRLEAKEDNNKRTDLAFAAQKELFDHQHRCNEEAATKAEQSFTKQIEALNETFRQGRDALSDRIVALKERVDRGVGRETQQGENRQQMGWVIPVIVVGGIAMINLILNLIQFIKS